MHCMCPCGGSAVWGEHSGRAVCTVCVHVVAAVWGVHKRECCLHTVAVDAIHVAVVLSTYCGCRCYTCGSGAVYILWL